MSNAKGRKGRNNRYDGLKNPQHNLRRFVNQKSLSDDFDFPDLSITLSDEEKKELRKLL